MFRHDDAIEAKKSRQKSHEKQFGPKGGKNQMSEGAEKTMYIGLVSYLKENVSYEHVLKSLRGIFVFDL